MKYMGSKNRHAKDILPIIVAARKAYQYYVEPFVGGFNMIDKVSGPRIANDSHKYLIALFKKLQEGWVPPDWVSEEEYLTIRIDKDKYPDHVVGFAGFCCSYSGKWFGGYARGNDAKGYPRNYCLESKKNLLKQVPKIQGIDIRCGSYLDLKIPANSLCIVIRRIKTLLNTTAHQKILIAANSGNGLDNCMIRVILFL